MTLISGVRVFVKLSLAFGGSTIGPDGIIALKICKYVYTQT